MLIRNWALHKIPEESALKRSVQSCVYDVLARPSVTASSRCKVAQGMPGRGVGQGGKVGDRVSQGVQKPIHRGWWAHSSPFHVLLKESAGPSFLGCHHALKKGKVPVFKQCRSNRTP